MELNCIFCTTPFQIMTALHLSMHANDISQFDLYIVDQFENAETLSYSLRKLNVFRNVILIHENKIINRKSKSKLVLWPQMILSYFQLNKTARKILGDNVNIKYDKVFIASKAYTSRIVVMFYAKNHYGSEIIYFDDGLGSYYNQKTIYPRLGDRLLRKFILGQDANLVEPKRILLYAPDLFYNSEVNAGRNLIVEKIPKWSRNDKCAEIMNDVFGFSQIDFFEEPILILDGLYREDEKKRLNEFYIKVAEIAGQENVIIKKHPRDREAEQANLKYCKRSSIPFELICQNMEMDKKLLITVASTAVITPVLLFSVEPYVLIVNNVQGMTEDHSNAHYCEFKDMYTDKNRFHEATSTDDALAFVKSFCEKCIT